MEWVSHSNMPILSVDVQPNGFRFVTGGSDHKVCIWNLMPAISLKYENPPLLAAPFEKVASNAEEIKNDQSNDKASRNGDKSRNEDHKMSSQNRAFEGDEVMHDEGSDQDCSESPGKIWRDRDYALKLEDEEGFESDIQLMEGLFDNPKKRYQKLLAVLDNHSSPVNCVRWNNIGTLFASASDEGCILLWEYVGEVSNQASFQMLQLNTSGDTRMGGLSGAQAAFEESKTKSAEKEQETGIYEEWRNKRMWRIHKGGVSDLAWSPDNIHFASCGTDSLIIIWSINEGAPIKMIETKANGIAFDPFGKFMASQSSEERSLSIWRIQQNFKNITQECSHHSFYKQSMGMSLFRRLSWSADGQFISTTAGKVGGMHTAPLIERSSWKLIGTLAGHSKTITSSRINPRLYRDTNTSEGLSCYSIVAIASIDSTISVWKPGMEKPLTVVMDIFRMGISDLSWGFNGNILLASSHDGKVVCMHYQPGRLGQPLSELEKQLIIEKRYGASVLNEYKNHTKVQQLNNIVPQVSKSDEAKQVEQKNSVVNGKKKIVPVMTRQYVGDSNSINPHLNPFFNQMLKDDSAASYTAQLQPAQPAQPSFFPPMTPSIPQAAPKPIETVVSQAPSVSQQPPLQNSAILQVVVNDSVATKPLISLVDTMQISENRPQSSLEVEEIKGGEALENSGKKTKKTKKKGKEEPSGLGLSMQQPIMIQPSSSVEGKVPQAAIGQQIAQSIVQNAGQGKQGGMSQSTIQALQKEQYQSLERLFQQDPSQQTQLTVISLEDYQTLTSISGKEEMQLTLPARDIFSDEIRVFINNIDGGGQNGLARKRCAEIRLYSGGDNIEVSRQVLDGEFILMTSLCGAFYILYTSKGQLHIFSSLTTQVIKQGLMIEGICCIDANEESNAFATLTLKGLLSLYRVKNLQQQASGNFQQMMLDAVTLDWQTSLVDVLKQRNSQAWQQQLSDDLSTSRVSVKYMKLLNDSAVLIFLSDNTVFEYDNKVRAWRQTLIKSHQALQMPEQLKSLSQDLNRAPVVPSIPLLKDLSTVIQLLESQSLQQSSSDDADPHDLQLRLNDLQESLSLYERLHMKPEFLYTLRMLTLNILQLGDMGRLRELMIEYKFVMTWEEEMQQARLNGRVGPEQAYQNIMQMINGVQNNGEQEDAVMAPVSGEPPKKMVSKVFEKPQQLICGGIEKSQVFEQAVLPVIRTICNNLQCEVKEYVAKLVQIMFGSEQHSKQTKQQQLQQAQPKPQHNFDSSALPDLVNPLLSSVQQLEQQSFQSLPTYPKQPSFHQQVGISQSPFQTPPLAYQQQQPPQFQMGATTTTQLPSIHNVFTAAMIGQMGQASSMVAQHQQHHYIGGNPQQQQYQ